MALYKTCAQCQSRNPIIAMRCKCGLPLEAYRPTSDGEDASRPVPIRSTTRSTLASPARGSARHYLARYWRGELSLAHSFWITNCLIDAGVALVQHLLGSRQETTSSPVLVHRLETMVLFLQMFLLSPWQMVGLWRSARQHIAATSCWVWGRGAQGLVVFGVLVTLVSFPFWFPAYLEMAKVAIGTDAYRYTVTLSEDGNMLRVEGGIGLGLAQAVTQELSRHPGVEVIAFNSQGGLWGEARKIQTLIEQRGLSTYADTQCQSACTHIFLAGAQRMLHKDAQLGFHRGHIPGVPDMMMQAENEQDKQYMFKHGVAQGFVDKAMSTPAYEMWMPTRDELIQAGVVTDIVEGTHVVLRPRFLNIGTGESKGVHAGSPTIVAFPNTPGVLSLELPGFHTDTDEMKAGGRRYLMASHPQTGLIVSVTLERGPTAASRQGCVMHLAQLKNGPFVVRGYDVTFNTSDSIPRLDYTIAEAQGVRVEQKNVRACFAQDNIYGDLHLSKIQYRAADAPLFDAVLSTVHLIGGRPQERPTETGTITSFELFQKGSAYYLQNQYVQAIPLYQQAVDLEKASPQLNKTLWRVLVDNLGMAYGMTGHLTEAKTTFEYGISADPTYPMFHYNLACTYAEMNARDDAMRSLETAVSYRQNQNAGERMPDPRKDSSFQRFMGQPDFRNFLNRLMATNS